MKKCSLNKQRYKIILNVSKGEKIMSATINDSVFDTIQRIRVEQEKKKKELEFVKRTLNLGQ